MGPSVEKTLSRPNRPSRTTTQWLFRPYWKRVRFQLGDRVHVSRSPRASPGKYASGRLRFWGKIHCAAGYWAGIELELPYGQNDGSLYGHRYFFCHPNRGLFVRIARCRTRAGHGASHARHVSFSTRTPGKNADRDTWNAKPSRVTTSNNASVHRAKGGPSKPCRSEVYRRRSNAGTSNGTLPPSCREKPRADVRLNAVRWVPVGQSRPGHNEAPHGRFGIQSETNPLEGASLGTSEGSSSSASSESSASDGDSPEELDLDQVLDEILAPPSKIAGAIAIPPASEASKSDSGTPSTEASKAERRRQMLINSYSHWARTRDRHRRREQGRTSGGTKRAATIEDHGKEAVPSTRTPVLAPSNQARTVWRNIRTEPDHPKRDGGIDGACRDVLSLRVASRQFLLSRSLHRARIFVAAGRFHDIPRGPNSIRADLPHGQAELSSACRSIPYGLVIPHAASVEIRTLADDTEVTEHALALTKEVAGRTDAMVVSPPSFATGVEAVFPTEPRGGLLQTAQRPDDRHAQRQKTSRAPSQRLSAATTPEWRENGHRGPKSCGEWSSLMNVPMSRPFVGFERYPTSTPSSEKVVDVRSGVKAGINGDAGGEHGHGLPCREVVVWSQAMGIEGINVERRARRPGPTESGLPEGRPASSWNAPHFTHPSRAKEVESRGVPAGGMVVFLPLRRRSMVAGDDPKRHSPSSGPLTKAAAVTERALITRSAQKDTEWQHRVVPFLKKEGASSPSKEHSPGGTVAIFCPAGALSTPPALGALQLQKQVVSGSDGGGFGGVPPPARREKHTKVYDANVLQADRGMKMVSGGSRSLPHMPAVKGATASALRLRSDDEDVRGEDRIARYCTAQFAVNTTPCGRTPDCQADPGERVGRRGRRRGAGVRPAPAALEKDNRRQWERSRSSHASTPAVTCSQAPCPIGASSAAGDLNPPVPGGSIARERNGTSPADLIRHETKEPARRTHIPESREGRIRSVERGRSRAEKTSWSRTAPILTQAREDVRGKHHDISSEGEPVEPSSSGRGAEGHSLPPTARVFGQLGKRSACGNQQLESGLLALADRGEDDVRPHVSDVSDVSDGQGVSKASRAEALRLDVTPPAVPEQLEAQPAKQLSTLSSPAGLGVPSLSSRLPLPPSPCRPSPPLVGGSGIPDNERDISELAEDGPGAPALPADRMVQESLKITPPATCPLGRLSSFPLPLSPPALRSGRSGVCEICPAEKLDDDARGPSAPSAAWQSWVERWRPGSYGKGNDLDQGWTTCVRTLVTTSSRHERSEPTEASAEAVIVCDLGRKTRSTEGNHDLTVKHPRSGLENRQHRADSTANLQGHEESRAQWSEHSDSSKRAGRESRQRHRQRYPPPPGPPPSPTPAVGRGKTCSTWNNRSSSSQRRYKLSLEKQEGRTRANVISEGAAKLGTPTHDLTVDHELFNSSPRSFDVEGRSAPTDSEEYTAIQDLAEVAVDWLPPPTPPPPEARRRRQRPAGPPPSPASPQPTPATRACFAQTPSSPLSPPPPPSLPSPAASPPHKRISITGGEEQHGPRGKSTRHERGHRSPVSKDFGVLIDHRCKSTESENKTPVEKSGSDNDMNVAATTIRSAGEGVTGDKVEAGSPSSRRESWCRRGTRKRGATAGAWADSYEGSVAKRRADTIFARIAALESYFDRVEEQAVATPPSSLARGAAATEGQARTTQEDSARAGDVRSDATEGATFTDGVKPTLKAGMKVTTKGEQDAQLVNDDNLHLTFYPGDQRPSAASPLAQEAQGWSRTEKLSIEEGHADPGAVAGLNGPPSSLDQGIAISSAIYSSGQVPEGHGEHRRESDGAGGDLSKEPQSRFYFNLGRNMVLGDFEWESTASGSVVASLTGSACGR